MERRLNEAAIEGNTTSLLELLQEDALVLDRIMVTSSVDETPLHIAAMLGHLDFAREILSRKSELSRELNSQGYSPLHLASAKGHVEMVRELLKADSEACMLRGPDGRTALHAAGIKGRVEVIQELTRAMPELTRVLTDHGETVLHVCLAHNQIEAAKLLIEIIEDEEILKSKDHKGDTALHVAVTKRQIQMVKLLLSRNCVEVNAVNAIGITALDVLLLSPSQPSDMEIGEILRGAGAMRANNHQMALSKPPLTLLPKKMKERKHLWKKESTIMVVAILIATMTFEGGLNPPNWDKFKDANAECTEAIKNRVAMNGTVVLGCRSFTPYYDAFIMIDTMGFLSSLSIIVLIISGFPHGKRYLMWVLNTIMMISVASVALLFVYWLEVMDPTKRILLYIPMFWLGLIGLLLLWQLVRFGLWLLKKCLKVAKRERGKETFT